MDKQPTPDEFTQALASPLLRAMEAEGITPEFLARTLKDELTSTTPSRHKLKGLISDKSKLNLISAKTVIETEHETLIQIDDIDRTTRQKARMDAHKLRGDYAPEKVEHSASDDLMEALTRAKQKAKAYVDSQW